MPAHYIWRKKKPDCSQSMIVWQITASSACFDYKSFLSRCHWFFENEGRGELIWSVCKPDNQELQNEIEEDNILVCNSPWFPLFRGIAMGRIIIFFHRYAQLPNQPYK